MTTDRYQNKLAEKIDSICDFVINSYPTEVKDRMLKHSLTRELRKHEYLRDLVLAEVQFKNFLKRNRCVSDE